MARLSPLLDRKTGTRRPTGGPDRATRRVRLRLSLAGPLRPVQRSSAYRPRALPDRPGRFQPVASSSLPTAASIVIRPETERRPRPWGDHCERIPPVSYTHLRAHETDSYL